MQANIPRDAEAAMRALLAAHLDVPVLVMPLPKDMPAKSVSVRRTGGSRRDMVVDTSMLSVDCRAESVADATELADLAAGITDALPGASLNALPYANPDPERPDIARITFTALVTLRAQTQEVQ